MQNNVERSWWNSLRKKLKNSRFKKYHIIFVPKYSSRNIIAASVDTEELAHMEIVCAIVHQLTRNLSPEDIKKSGFDTYYVDHTLGIWSQAASGIPFSATVFQSKDRKSVV